MAAIQIELSHHRYTVEIGARELQRLGAHLARLSPDTQRCAVIADAAVVPLYGGAVVSSLRDAGIEPIVLELESGEGSKNLATVERLYRDLVSHRLERSSAVVALGGGVAGDTAGFVAATYLRGVPFVQCPTTLLSMVDSSVGGKVGVNLPEGKNLVGAFYQPLVVIADPTALATLPPRELRSGLAECIKHGVIRSPEAFAFLEAHADGILALDPALLSDLVGRNVAIKAAVVSEDERESGARAHLNYGHTFAHAIEACLGYGTLLHGEAVGLGMIAAAHLASRLQLCDAALTERVTALVSRCELPTRFALPPADVLARAMKLDKKVQAARVRFVLAKELGTVDLYDDVPEALVEEAWAVIRA